MFARGNENSPGEHSFSLFREEDIPWSICVLLTKKKSLCERLCQQGSILLAAAHIIALGWVWDKLYVRLTCRLWIVYHETRLLQALLDCSCYGPLCYLPTSQHLHSSHLVLLGHLPRLNSAKSLVQLSAPLVDSGEDYFPPLVSFGQLLSRNLPSFLVANSSVNRCWQYLV